MFAKLAKDPDWQSGNAKLGGIAAIRSPADTERFVHKQFGSCTTGSSLRSASGSDHQRRVAHGHVP